MLRMQYNTSSRNHIIWTSETPKLNAYVETSTAIFVLSPKKKDRSYKALKTIQGVWFWNVYWKCYVRNKKLNGYFSISKPCMVYGFEFSGTFYVTVSYQNRPQNHTPCMVLSCCQIRVNPKEIRKLWHSRLGTYVRYGRENRTIKIGTQVGTP